MNQAARHRGTGRPSQLLRRTAPKPKPTTLRGVLLHRVRTLAICAASFTVAFTALHQADLTMTFAPRPEPAQAADPVEVKLEQLSLKYECWSSGPAPRDITTPGGVIYGRGDANTPTAGGAKMVYRALDEVFAGGDTGLRVYAFCRYSPQDGGVQRDSKQAPPR